MARLTLWFILGFLSLALNLLATNPISAAASGLNVTLGNITLDEAYTICMSSAACRTVYEQEHGEYSPNHFARLAAAPVQSLQSASIEQLVVDHLVLRRTLYAESRCPPNHYLRWNAEGTATCTCYLDRDCAAGSLPICYDTLHPILIFCIITIILLFSIVYCCTSATPHTKQHHSRAAV